jgi:hypothetical protein
VALPGADLAARVGVARREITPPVGIRARLWGAATHDVAAGVHRPLTATALAMVPAPADSDGHTTTRARARVILSLDVMEWQHGPDERVVRDRVLARCGLDERDLLLHATHSHSAPAPCTVQADLPGGERMGAYLEAVAEACADAAVEALASAEPAVLAWGVGASRLAAHRDQVLDGRAVVGWQPDVAADDTLLVGRVTTAGGRVSAVVVSYACHPTVLGWANALLSPDYVGALREDVERRHPGALCLFVQGASGELAPVRQYGGDVTEADRAGRALALDVAATLLLMDPPGRRPVLQGVVESGAPLGVWRVAGVPTVADVTTATLTVPLVRRAAPGLPSRAASGADLPEHVRAERAARARLVAQEAGAADSIDYPVWVWELGELVLVAHPGEAYSWLARHLRAALAPRPVLVANLTNGAGAFYLPPAPAYDVPSYTVGQTPAGAGSLEAVAAAVLAHLGVDAPPTEVRGVQR